MSYKYKCPLCGTVYACRYEAKDCMKDCFFEEYGNEYDVIGIDTIEYVKKNIKDYVGKCETCRHTDDEGRTFADCPRSGLRDPSDGCEAYTPDTQTFGTIIETLWNEQQEARG